MKITINQELQDQDGKSIPGANNKNVTLKEVCITSILSPIQGDEEQSKMTKYIMFKKFRDAEIEVDLIAEEIVVLKKAIAHFQPQLIMGQCFEMIEK